MNGVYLNEMPEAEFSKLALPRLVAAGYIDEAGMNDERNEKIIRMLQPRTKRLADIAGMTGYFFSDPGQYDEKGVRKHWKDAEKTVSQLKELKLCLSSLASFDIPTIETAMRDLAERLEISAGKLIHPLRLALTGQTFSPSIFEVLEVLGWETADRRIEKAILFVQDSASESEVTS
jgi:glutamyl-tRNA synthetase